MLLWLGMSGPGFLGYGTSLLWGGLPKGEMKPYYAIKVEPGNKTIRKRSDLMITATLTGFQAPKVRFFAKYASASQWEQAEMRTEPGGSSYQFLIAGVPDSLEYYVEAGGVRSPSYKLNVVDLPNVKNIRVTYHYPAWLGAKEMVEDPGGDLRAVEGTSAEVAIRTDRPLATAARDRESRIRDDHQSQVPNAVDQIPRVTVGYRDHLRSPRRCVRKNTPGRLPVAAVADPTNRGATLSPRRLICQLLVLIN